jgi:hypothetical protein
MKKSSISKATDLMAMGEFWDKHDLSDYWDKTSPVKFDVKIESEESYYSVDKEISESISRVAQKRGVPAGTLVNLWLQEKLRKLKVA